MDTTHVANCLWLAAMPTWILLTSSRRRYRWQVDESFVDFDPDDVEGELETVASQWPTLARWETVSYRGQDRHAASPIGARASKSKL
jgi:hypothetical protein